MPESLQVERTAIVPDLVPQRRHVRELDALRSAHNAIGPSCNASRSRLPVIFTTIALPSSLTLPQTVRWNGRVVNDSLCGGLPKETASGTKWTWTPSGAAA